MFSEGGEMFSGSLVAHSRGVQWENTENDGRDLEAHGQMGSAVRSL